MYVTVWLPVFATNSKDIVLFQSHIKLLYTGPKSRLPTYRSFHSFLITTVRPAFACPGLPRLEH